MHMKWNSEMKRRIYCFINKIDYAVVFVAIATAFAVAYYINPLVNVDLREWNRTFCPAALSNISIDRRISNYYTLFLLYLPGLSLFLIVIYSYLFDLRKKYRDYYIKYSVFLLLATAASYISRYEAGSMEVSANPLLQCMLGFLVIMTVTALVDRSEQFTFSDITMLFIVLMIGVITLNMLVIYKNTILNIAICGSLIVVYSWVTLRTACFDKIQIHIKNGIFMMFWLPVILRVALE